jgi:hypothetical protein
VTGPPSDAEDEADPAADRTAGPRPGRPEHGSDEEIDEASDESFPASDAPQWWSGGPADDDS